MNPLAAELRRRYWLCLAQHLVRIMAVRTAEEKRRRAVGAATQDNVFAATPRTAPG